MKAKCETIRIGRRIVGGLYQTSGRPIFLAYRWVGDVWRDNKPDIAAAIRSDKAMWTIEEDIVRRMRMNGVPVVGVIVRDTGERYVAGVEAWFADGSRGLELRGRSGSFRALPFSKMQRFTGKPPRLR